MRALSLSVLHTRSESQITFSVMPHSSTIGPEGEHGTHVA